MAYAASTHPTKSDREKRRAQARQPFRATPDYPWRARSNRQTKRKRRDRPEPIVTRSKKRSAQLPTPPSNVTSAKLGTPLQKPQKPTSGFIEPIDNEKLYKPSRTKERLLDWFSPFHLAAETVMASFKSVSDDLHKRQKDMRELNPEVQQKIAFAFSTFLGTLCFLGLFQCLFAAFTRILELASYAFGLAYCIAYLMSVIWQHVLNRWLVFQQMGDSFCETLMQTYLIYGFTLLCSSIVSAGLFSFGGIHPQVVLLITLPLSGIGNFFLLRYCLIVDDASEREGEDENIIIV